MDETVGVARPAHRALLHTALSALRTLQGKAAIPREHRIIELTAGIYELRMFSYPLPLTAQHMRAVERLPHVTLVEVNFSVAGVTPGVFGALCVRLDLSTAASAKRTASVIDDEAEADDTFEVPRAAPGKPSAAEDKHAESWIGWLFGSGP